uniref:G-protein coupled receptors family 1 profile domain-containing protein n=1 Tax=Plectus sambesii TaxID=2011161 RepID=A0A914X8W9_9BILA
MDTGNGSGIETAPEQLYACFVDDFEWSLGLSLASWLLNGPVTTVTAVLGALGNLSSVFMLRMFAIRHTIRLYLSVLAGCNAVVCVCSLFFYSSGEMLRPFIGTNKLLQHITVIFHPISNISMTATIWMLATVTSERHWAIWKPLQHRAIDTKRRAQTICIVLILIAFLFCLPTFFELRVAECRDAQHQRIEHLAWPTALRLDELYLSIYSIGMNSIFITFGPFAIITCLTARMVFIVARARRERGCMDGSRVATRNGRAPSGRPTTGNDRGKESTTVMLLAVAVKFLLCNYMQIALNVWEKIGGSEVSSSDIYSFCVDVSNYMIVANSASDCLIYIRWRKKLLATRRKKELAASSSTWVDSCAGAPPGSTGSHCPLLPMTCFTVAETHIVRETWHAYKLKHSSSANCIGDVVLRTFTEKKPELRELLNPDMVTAEAQRITRLVEEMVEVERRDDAVVEGCVAFSVVVVVVVVVVLIANEFVDRDVGGSVVDEQVDGPTANAVGLGRESARVCAISGRRGVEEQLVGTRAAMRSGPAALADRNRYAVDCR